MKQTAVEWLQDTWLNYPDLCSYDKIQEWFKQAKEMEKAENIKAQIEVLIDINLMNANLFYIERPVKEISKEDCIERWNKTVWARTSLNKIAKLEQQLKELTFKSE
jgi:uncharacterized protein (UPF0303 family)